MAEATSIPIYAHLTAPQVVGINIVSHLTIRAQLLEKALCPTLLSYTASANSGGDRSYEVQISASDSLASSSVSTTNIVEDGEEQNTNSAPTTKISLRPDPAVTLLSTET